MSYGSDTWQKWVLNEDKALLLFKAAWDAGIQTWDTANAYSNGPLLPVTLFLCSPLSLSILFPCEFFFCTRDCAGMSESIALLLSDCLIIWYTNGRASQKN
jgi:hypothetical protein